MPFIRPTAEQYAAELDAVAIRLRDAAIRLSYLRRRDESGAASRCAEKISARALDVRAGRYVVPADAEIWT